jgi:hypothetical protein
VPITIDAMSSNPVHGEVYSIQHYVIKFVSDLRQVGGFLFYFAFNLYLWPHPVICKKIFLLSDYIFPSPNRSEKWTNSENILPATKTLVFKYHVLKSNNPNPNSYVTIMFFIHGLRYLITLLIIFQLQGFQYFSSAPVLLYLQVVFCIQMWTFLTNISYNTLWH